MHSLCVSGLTFIKFDPYWAITQNTEAKTDSLCLQNVLKLRWNVIQT